MFQVLRDRMSMREMVSYQLGDSEYEMQEPPYPKLLCDQRVRYKAILIDSIKRALNFYADNIHDLGFPDHAFALLIVNAINKKHGGPIEKNCPFEKYIEQICMSLIFSTDFKTCLAFAAAGEAVVKSQRAFLPQDIVREAARKYYDETLGNEKETAWTTINSYCIEALLLRCEVPHVCERVMYDPIPRANYQLSHQILHRLLAETIDCPNARSLKSFYSPDINLDLCSKMYAEAQLLAKIDDDVQLSHFHDLFAEHVGLCAYVGFPNFLRADWLERFISRQTKHNNGCFVTRGESKFFTNDKPLSMKYTDQEVKAGTTTFNDGMCKPHLTSVSVVALTAFWNYIEEVC